MTLRVRGLAPPRAAAGRSVSGAFILLCVCTGALAQTVTETDTQTGDKAFPVVAFGGEVRQKVEANSNPGFGLVPSDGNGFVTMETRLAANADVRLAPAVRLYGEVAHASQWGRDSGPRPFDESDLSAIAAYVELDDSEAGDVVARIGRQPLAFGSFRLSSIRNGVGTRRSFDAARVSAPLGSAKLDAFYGREVQVGDGIFDDAAGVLGGPPRGPAFWGVYAEIEPAKGESPGFDAYYFGLGRDDAVYADASGDETRHSLNARLHGKTRGVDYDLEGAWQVGSVGRSDIQAWGLGGDVGYAFNALHRSPRLGLRANYASGDRTPSDGELGSYNPYFPALVYFSFAVELAPTNTTGFRPSLSVSPIDGLTVEASTYLTRRSVRDDAV